MSFISLPNAPASDWVRRRRPDRGIKLLAVLELPTGAVRADEEQLGLPALIGIRDSVRLPAARADTAHPRAFRAAEHADVTAGPAISVHALHHRAGRPVAVLAQR